MVYITAVASRFPPHYYSQEELITRLQKAWSKKHSNPALVERFHRNVMVDGRYLALPVEAYQKLNGFGNTNSAWTQTALMLGEQVICDLLEQANIEPDEIAQLMFTTVTGVAVPSIDARLMNRIPFPPHMKRVPLFGLGCLGGAAGIARTADYLVGHPYDSAILLSIELCSLTMQLDDLSVANLISSGLFGDGAAAVLLVGERHPLAQDGQPQVVDSRSIFFSNTEYIMGWEVIDSGFKIQLSPDVAEIAEVHLRPAVDDFLGEHGLSVGEIDFWIAHPGGPKVIQAIENGLGLGVDALSITRESLAKVGNISSTSVLHILQETLARNRPAPGSYGLLMAMGPAFCAELVLLQW
jgi:alkylresorcinol/alkylpyrone synthase